MQEQPNELVTQVVSDSNPLHIDQEKIYERLKIYTKAFAGGFTEILENYRDETTISPKSDKSTIKVAKEAAVAVVGDLSNLASAGIHAVTFGATYVNNKNNREKAKRIVEVFSCIKDNDLNSMLIEAGTNIFYNYQSRFTVITDKRGYWKRGMQKLAVDATKRAINYINQYKEDNPDMNVSVDLIIEGVVLGQSEEGFMTTLKQKIPKMPKLGHTVKMCNEKYKTSEVYENMDLGRKRDRTVGKDCSKKSNGSNSRKSKDTSGLTQKLNEGNQKMTERPQKEYKREYVLWLEQLKEEAISIKKIIDRQESKQVREPIWFNMTDPVNSFTGRHNELKRLHEALQKGGKQVIISQVAAVTGLGGIGKTELVRKYAKKYIKHYDNNVIWIDSETQKRLTESFRKLVKELNIVINETTAENIQEMQVTSIVKNVYKHFSEMKCLFIFDNAEEYTAIAKFLPPSLHPDAKRPYILITSRNRNWNVKVDDIQIYVMQLHCFTPEEAATFIKRAIKKKGGLRKRDIEMLVERLKYFPLALRQAVAYINQEDEKLSRKERFKISDYLKEDEETRNKLLNEGSDQMSDRYSATVLTTWTTTIEKIKKDQTHGATAIDILNVMAYLSPDKIHTSEMFDSDSVELCHKYSMIDLKERGVASIHRLVQEYIRLQLRNNEGKEEEVLKDTLKLIENNENISKENTSHVTSVWSYASGYNKIIDEFYFNSNSIPIYGYNDSTPLHLLAENGNDKAVNAILDEAILLKKEFSKIIDVKDKYNRTPLYMAVENGHVNVVKLLIDKGAKIDVKSTIVYNSLTTKKASNWTLLHIAAFNGYSDIVKILVAKDITLVNVVDSTGRTAAVLAACTGQINILKILKPQPYNVYLLHAKFRAARQSGNLEDLKKFLKKLEDKHELRNIIDMKLGEWAPLHLAAFANWLDITKILITYGAKLRDAEDSFTPLHAASSNGHLAIIKCLLDNGASLDYVNKSGWTSLHAAAQNGHLHVVKYFINVLKIDVNIKDKKGTTPLHTAAFHGKLNVVKFLLSKEANISAVDILGTTPLFSAAISNNRDIRNFLLMKNPTLANTNQTIFGSLISLLHIAAAYDDKQMIAYLINEGVDKDIGKGIGPTPLCVAYFFGSSKAIKYLSAKGAATNVRIDLSSVIETYEKAEKNNASESFKIPGYVRRLINIIKLLPRDISAEVDDFKNLYETSTDFLGPDCGRLMDSLKIYVKQKKTPDLNLPMHATFFTQEGIGINSKGDGR